MALYIAIQCIWQATVTVIAGSTGRHNSAKDVSRWQSWLACGSPAFTGWKSCVPSRRSRNSTSPKARCIPSCRGSRPKDFCSPNGSNPKPDILLVDCPGPPPRPGNGRGLAHVRRQPCRPGAARLGRKTAMTTLAPLTDNYIETYLNRLANALAAVAPAERDEIVREIRAHILDSVSGATDPDGAVDRVLRLLGTPAELADR